MTAADMVSMAPAAPKGRTLDEEARALAAMLPGRHVEINDLRRLPDDVWRTLVDSGLLHAMQPKRWGGGEVHPWEFYRCVMDIAAANASAGWVTGVLGIHAWQTATYAPETQDEFWGKDARTVNSSSYGPTGSAKIVDGGYELSGRWEFSSGSDHCTWVNVGGIPGMMTLDGQAVPDFRSFLVPLGDYSIERTWNTIGLSGTGSHDIVINRCFVPARRSISHWDYFTGATLPGWAYNDGPLYRIPWGILFGFALAAAVFGAAEGFFNEWVSISKKRVGNLGLPAVDDPTIQALATRSRYVIDAARLMMERDCNDLMEAAVSRRALSLERRAQMRFAASHSAQLLGKLVDDLHQKSSGKIVFRDHPLQHRYQDVKGMIGHLYLDPESAARAAGCAMLGGRPLPNFTL